MAKIAIRVQLNARAAIWFHFLADKKRMDTMRYMSQVLLKHLNETPGVDLSQSPYIEPKGVSNGQEE